VSPVGPTLNDLLCFRIYRASRVLTRAYAPLLAEVGLTYPQYLVMVLLWEDPDRPLTVGGIGERLDLDSATLTPLLKRLEAVELLHRRRDPADERRVLIELTAAGLALRESAASVPVRVAECLGVTETEGRRLVALIDKLI
jgi:DNA-binding MarR family transcriptional regulator